MPDSPPTRPAFEWDDDDLPAARHTAATGGPEDGAAGEDEPAPDLEFTGEVVEWRGPAPFHFLVVPKEECAWLTEVMREVTYGWGMVPVTGRVGGTDFTTSLWPRKGSFYVPLKDAVRHAEGIELGDTVRVALTIRSG
ncbi:hypothetical protein SGUI_0917 [Serinicoccus hydrothermalis]|uniref:DUF1905 domain-containing protein n=1 Tax=Serinicoccus hydrothermalis TaxID=1758689 RepID=A0A1B1NA45_9MICO|nr:DUF1905 domain-containing protein [Serinicoccus hydrothermalis]ANS78313.1 hypothetical protein SGUI_0917 [Serinicoccus hydrothermalis]